MKNNEKLINLIFICVGIGLSIGVFVLNILDKISIKDSLSMLGLGLFCICLYLLKRDNNK